MRRALAVLALLLLVACAAPRERVHHRARSRRSEAAPERPVERAHAAPQPSDAGRREAVGREANERLREGDLRFDERDFAAAVTAYSACLALDPGCARARANRGVAYGHLDQDAAAIIDLTEALKDVPDYGFGFMSRGSARLRLRDHAGAEADLDRALALEPWRQRASYLRAQARAWRGDAQGALEDVRRALPPPHTHVNLRRARDVEGQALLLLGEPRPALAAFDAAARADNSWFPQEDKPRFRGYLRAIAQALSGDLRAADATLLEVERERPDEVYPSVWRVLLGLLPVEAWPPPQPKGWEADVARWATGRLDDEAFVARAGARTPEAHAFIGVMAEREGDRARALERYRLAAGPGVTDSVPRLWAAARLAQEARGRR